jgi:hypothetical protein
MVSVYGVFRYQEQKNNRRNLKDLNSTLLSDNGDALGKILKKSNADANEVTL